MGAPCTLAHSPRVTSTACVALTSVLPCCALRSMPFSPALHDWLSDLSPQMIFHKVRLNRAQSSLIFLSTCAFPSHLLCLIQAQRYGGQRCVLPPFTTHTHAVTGLQPLTPSPPVPFHRMWIHPVCTAAELGSLAHREESALESVFLSSCLYQSSALAVRFVNPKIMWPFNQMKPVSSGN